LAKKLFPLADRKTRVRKLISIFFSLEFYRKWIIQNNKSKKYCDIKEFNKHEAKQLQNHFPVKWFNCLLVNLLLCSNIKFTSVLLECRLPILQLFGYHCRTSYFNKTRLLGRFVPKFFFQLLIVALSVSIFSLYSIKKIYLRI